VSYYFSALGRKCGACAAPFPTSPYIEWPGSVRTIWCQAFDWIRTNTPENAYVAMDPHTMQMPDEDKHVSSHQRKGALADDVRCGRVQHVPMRLTRSGKSRCCATGMETFQACGFSETKTRVTRSIGWWWNSRVATGVACPYENWRVRCAISIHANHKDVDKDANLTEWRIGKRLREVTRTGSALCSITLNEPSQSCKSRIGNSFQGPNARIKHNLEQVFDISIQQFLTLADTLKY